MHKATTLTEVRDLLVGRTIKSINFDHDHGEFRSIALRLDNHTAVTLTATAWQALTVESI